MIIWIVLGELQKRGTTDLEFVAACNTKKQVFHIINEDNRVHYKTWKACRYDLGVNKWIGSSEFIYPGQKYNHTQDGHLDPPENRKEDGTCKSMMIWGPYCYECQKMILGKLKTP